MVSIVRFDRQQNTAGTQYTNIVQVQFASWGTSSSTTTANTYQNVTNGTLTITPYYTNSKFMIIPVCQGYVAGVSGSNIGLNRTVGGTTTRILGVDGGSGDTWMGSNNGFGTNSWNINRHWVDSPGVTAGTPITYQVLYALWSAGTIWVNYPGYSATSSITVFEVLP
jgi:hypothetical protein